MTELERARAHLLWCQAWLSDCRRANYETIPSAEDAVLAALNWVWEEQEKDRFPGDWQNSRWRVIRLESFR